MKPCNAPSVRATLAVGLLLLALIVWPRPTSGLVTSRLQNVTSDGRCSGADYTRLTVADPSGLGRAAVCVGGLPHFLTKGLPARTVGTNTTAFDDLPGGCPPRYVEEARANEAAGRHRAGDPVYLSCGAYAPTAAVLRGSGVPTGLPGQYSFFVHNSRYRPQTHLNSLVSVHVRMVEKATGKVRYHQTVVKQESCLYFHTCYMELRETSVEGFAAYLPGRAVCTEAALRLLGNQSFAARWSHNFNAPTGSTSNSPCYGNGGTHYNEYQYAVWELVRINCGTEVDCSTTVPPTTSTPPSTTTPAPGSTTPPGNPSGTTLPPAECRPGDPGCLAPCEPGSAGCVDPCPGGVCPPPPNFCDMNPSGLSCTPFDASGVSFEVVIDHPAQYAAKGSFLAQGARIVSTRLRCDGRTCNPGPDNLDPSKVSLTGRLRLVATSDTFSRCTRVGQSGCSYLLVTTDNDNAIRQGEAVKSYFFSPTRTSEAVNVFLASPAGRVQTYRWEPIYERVEVPCEEGDGACYESVFTGEYRRVADRVISVPVVVRNTAGQTLPPAGVFLRVFGSVGS